MSTKIQVSIIIFVILITTLLTVGFFLLRDRAIKIKNNPQNTQDTSHESPNINPSPSPSPTQNKCTHNNECAWFSKITETNSGTPEEKVSVTLSCQNVNYLESCGPDCIQKGNTHPFDASASACLCIQGACSKEEQ